MEIQFVSLMEISPGPPERHTATPHYRNYIAAVAGLIVDKVVHKMSRTE
jgi:hypothetical protein